MKKLWCVMLIVCSFGLVSLLLAEVARAGQLDMSARSCINVGPSGNNQNESRYDNSCPYPVEIQIARYCNGSIYMTNTVIRIPANSFATSPIFFSACSPLGGNTSTAPLVGARKVN